MIALSADDRARYMQLIESRFGLRLAAQQATQLDELVGQLLEQFGGTTDWLYESLAGGRFDNQLQTLAAGLTIQETHFFRVIPQIEALRRHVLPALLQSRQDASAQGQLSIWSAGCSTGEEPYTLAILLHEGQPALAPGRVDVLGTDLSPTALARAAAARYGEWSFRDTPAEIRARYFIPEERHWRLIEPVRRLVRFSPHNLIADPFPTAAGGFDLILCRNVTIYFSAQTTQRLYQQFAEALAPGGWLLLGPSDSPPLAPTSLEACYLDGAIFWRRRAVSAGATLGESKAARSPVLQVASRRPVVRPGQPAARVAPAAPLDRKPAPVRSSATAPAGAVQPWQLLRESDRRGARELAARLAAAAPLDAEMHLILGLLLLDSGEPGTALEVLRRTAFLAPNNALAQVGLGRAYQQLGTHERARASLSRARRLLAPLTETDLASGGGGVTAGELRRSIDVLFAECVERAR